MLILTLHTSLVIVSYSFCAVDENSNKGLQMTKMELRQMMEAVIRDWSVPLRSSRSASKWPPNPLATCSNCRSVLQERMEQQAAALNKQGEPAAEGCGYFFRSTSGWRFGWV